MKHIHHYEEFRFTIESKQQLYRHNIEFWQKIAEIERAEKCEITVCHSLGGDIQGTLDLLSFECENSRISEKADEVYRRCYHFAPLEPDPGGA